MKIRVLMVCLGNICRSPLAEGILRSKVNTLTVEVDSAGTGGWHAGEQPDPRSMDVAKKNGLDISYQRARKFTARDFEVFDYIFVMDTSNRQNVLNLAQSEEHISKVHLIMDELFPGENMDVPDPYYGGLNGFDQVFDMLDEACDSIAGRI